MTDANAPPTGPVAIALSAIANASQTPITHADVILMLRTGRGNGSHLRALFGDVDVGTLIRIAVEARIPSRDLWSAYLRARREAAAKNSELEEWAAGIV